jgi:hypothetical protein
MSSFRHKEKGPRLIDATALQIRLLRMTSMVEALTLGMLIDELAPTVTCESCDNWKADWDDSLYCDKDFFPPEEEAHDYCCRYYQPRRKDG